MKTKHTILFLAFAVVALTTSCSGPSDDAIVFTEIDGISVPTIYPEKIVKTSDVKISDWVDDIHFIPLETSEKSIYQYTMRIYIGKEYIVISTVGKGVLLFGADGHFIRTLAMHGKGPGEVMDANRNLFVDEKNQKVYITDNAYPNGKILCKNIDSDYFETIPLNKVGTELGLRDIIIKDDTLMLMTTMHMRGTKSECPLFCQTTKGELLWKITKTHPKGLTDAGISLVEDQIFFNYHFAQDTLFVLKGQKLEPSVIIASEKPRAYPDQVLGSIYLGLYPVTPNLFRGDFATVESVQYDERFREERGIMSKRVNYIYDSRKKEARLIGQLHNDYLGADTMFYPRFQYNGIFYAQFQAMDLLSIADSVYQIPDIPADLKSRLEWVRENVKAEDNPVLMVGMLKDI